MNIEKEFLAGDKTHPIILDLLLLGLYGSEMYGWEPETLWIDLFKKFGMPVAKTNRSKIQAVRSVHTSLRPFDSWEVFEKVVIGLNGIPVMFDFVQKSSIPETAFAVVTIKKLRTEKFTEEIDKYIAAVFMDAGLSFAPAPLDNCQRFIQNDETVNQQDAYSIRNEEDYPQLEHLFAMQDYLQDMDKELKRQLEIIDDTKYNPKSLFQRVR